MKHYSRLNEERKESGPIEEFVLLESRGPLQFSNVVVNIAIRQKTNEASIGGALDRHDIEQSAWEGIIANYHKIDWDSRTENEIYSIAYTYGKSQVVEEIRKVGTGVCVPKRAEREGRMDFWKHNYSLNSINEMTGKEWIDNIDEMISTEDYLFDVERMGDGLISSMNAILSPTERFVLHSMFGLDGAPKKNRTQVAESVGLSEGRISHIKKQALVKMNCDGARSIIRKVFAESEIGYTAQIA